MTPIWYMNNLFILQLACSITPPFILKLTAITRHFPPIRLNMYLEIWLSLMWKENNCPTWNDQRVLWTLQVFTGEHLGWSALNGAENQVDLNQALLWALPHMFPNKDLQILLTRITALLRSTRFTGRLTTCTRNIAIVKPDMTYCKGLEMVRCVQLGKYLIFYLYIYFHYPILGTTLKAAR